MTLDLRARALALRMFKQFGKSCTLKSTVAGAYDPATGTTTPVITSYSIKAYLDQPNRTELAGGQVVSTDEVAIFSALGLAVEPKVNDSITVDVSALRGSHGSDEPVVGNPAVAALHLVGRWQCTRHYLRGDALHRG